MKKLLCILLVFTLFVSICVTGVSANSIEEKLTEKFYDYCGGNKIDWNSPNISKDEQKVIIYEYKEFDDIVFFSAAACWYAPGAMGRIETFDKWRVYSPAVNHPSELGLYVLIDDNVYSIEEAWEKGLVTDLTPIEDFSKYTKVSRVENTESEQPTSVLSTEPTQPTSNPLTEPTEPIATSPEVTEPTQPVATAPSTPKVTSKNANPIKVTVKTKTVKAKKLKKKKQTIKPITIKGAQGLVTVSKVKNGTNAKIYKKITVNRKTGAITFKKGKYAKKTYKDGNKSS